MVCVAGVGGDGRTGILYLNPWNFSVDLLYKLPWRT